MKFKTLDEYVDSLTEKERKQFEDLIDETYNREKEIKENRSKSFESLDKLKKNIVQLNSEYNNMIVQLNNLNDALKALATKLDQVKKPKVTTFSPPTKDYIKE